MQVYFKCDPDKTPFDAWYIGDNVISVKGCDIVEKGSHGLVATLKADKDWMTNVYKDDVVILEAE